MSVSDEAKRRLATAVTSQAVAEELVAAIDSQGSGPAAVILAFGVTTNLTPLVVAAATFSTSAMAAVAPAAPTAAEVAAAINAATAKVKTVVDLKADNVDVETLRTEVEARLDAIEAKFDALLVAFKASSQMAIA